MYGKKRNRLVSIAVIVLGNILTAFGTAFFMESGQFIMGGVTGIGIFLHNTTGVPTYIPVFIMNMGFLLLGLIFLGKEFAANTVLSSLILPAALAIAEPIAQRFPLTDDVYLNMAFGALSCGIAIGFIMRMNASTGGFDIPPLIMNKYFHVPIAGAAMLCDIVVIGLQAFFFKPEALLYGLIFTGMYSAVLDKSILFGTSCIEVKVISKKSNEIRTAILKDMSRGVTLLQARTGYRNMDADIVMTVLSSRELPAVRSLIMDIDEDAFVVVTKITEVSGEGFTYPSPPDEEYQDINISDAK